MAVIGIDIGGTVIKGTDGNNFIHRTTPAAGGPLRLIDAVMEVIDSLSTADSPPGCISVGLPGLISYDGEILGEAANIPGLSGFPLKQRLSAQYNCPVLVANDVNLAAAAEYDAYLKTDPDIAGSPFIFISLGTGVGGGIILNGTALMGENAFAGEFGHIVLHPGGRQCCCGNRGCAEQYIAARGLQKALEEYSAEYSDGLAALYRNSRDPVQVSTISEYCRNGDPLALRIHSELTENLARLCGIIAGVLNPRTIILGGGIMNSGDLILRDTAQKMKRFTLQGMLNNLIIGKALHKERAGVIGAWLEGITYCKDANKPV